MQVVTQKWTVTFCNFIYFIQGNVLWVDERNLSMSVYIDSTIIYK